MEYHFHDYCGQDLELSTELEYYDENQENSDIVFKEKQGDELIIDLVRSYPFLYDKSNAQYKDKNMKEAAWTEILNILKLPASECQNRWLRLRQYYSKERSIMKKITHSGTSQIRKKKWPLFDLLSFLDKHIPTRKSFSNFSITHEGQVETDSSSSLSAVNKFGNDTSIISKEDLLREANKKQASDRDVKISEQPNGNVFPKSCFPEGQSKKQKKSNFDPVENTFLKINRSVQDMYEKLNQEENEDIFGKLVAAELRKMSDEKQKKKEILHILYTDE